MGVFEDLANQKPGMHWQHDRHHTTMLANPYDPSRDLSPNLPTTSCRGQEQLAAANAYDGVHGQCVCSAFKSEFDDECGGGGLHPSSDCCGDKLQLLHQVPPATMGVVVGGGGVGDDYRGGPLQAVQPCKLLQDDSSSPVHGTMQQHHHVQHHLQQQQHHRLLHHHHHPVVGYHAGSSPEPPSPPGMVQSSSYGEAAYDSSPPDVQRMLRPKREEEPAAAAAAAEVNLCDGCGLKILDRYYLLAVDKRWHATCLQCFQCSRTLATEIKCFYRDGNIYCKSDYQRLYAGVVRRCGRCQTAISPSELVMRARDTVYHVPCFSCAVCATALTKGDQFGMRDGAVFCQHHYRPPQQPVAMRSPAPHQVVQRRSPPQQQQTAMTPPAVCGGLAAVRSPYPSSGGGPLESPAAAFFCNGGSAAAAGNAADAPAPQPRQKGRPRKRKPKDLQDAMATNMDMNSSDSYNMEMAFGPGGLSGAGGNGGPGSGHQRTKRMRTSFKHHQLRTMKSYFHHNHNPDAKDLKQLSQKTGLPKRVLQVWFQNARAKYRRTASKQDGGGGGGLGSLQGPPSIKPEKSCSESSTGSTGIEAVMFHQQQQQQQQQQQHHSMQMSPRSYLSSSSPMMECT